MQNLSFFSLIVSFLKRAFVFPNNRISKARICHQCWFKKNFSKTKNRTADKITGQCFPVKAKVTCQNLAHLDKEKKFSLKSHLRGCCTKPFNCQAAIVNFFFCILNQDLCSMGLNCESVGEILKSDYFTYSY